MRVQLRGAVLAAGFFGLLFALPLLAVCFRLLGRVDPWVLKAVVLALVQGLQLALWLGVLGRLFRRQRGLALLLRSYIPMRGGTSRRMSPNTPAAVTSEPAP